MCAIAKGVWQKKTTNKTYNSDHQIFILDTQNDIRVIQKHGPF